MQQGLSSTEKRVMAMAQRFEIGALLEQMNRLGYGPNELRFRSVQSYVSQVSLIHSLRFQRLPKRRATVFVNFGLLGVQTPLPSYFFKELERSELDSELFGEFLAYFDHQLIKRQLLSLYPELDTHLFHDWQETKRHFLSLVELRAPSSMKWLFDLVYPDLGVKVEKAVLARSISSKPIVLGESKVGSNAIFGRKCKVPVYGFRITLYSEEDTFLCLRPWPKEVEERLEREIFPLLRPLTLDLEVLLVIKSQKSFAKLHRESFLGYDRIRGGRENYRRIRIFSGLLQDVDQT